MSVTEPLCIRAIGAQAPPPKPAHRSHICAAAQAPFHRGLSKILGNVARAWAVLDIGINSGRQGDAYGLAERLRPLFGASS
jgi:hypothetical protein